MILLKVSLQIRNTVLCREKPASIKHRERVRLKNMNHVTVMFFMTISKIASAEDVAKPVRVFILAGQSNIETASQN